MATAVLSSPGLVANDQLELERNDISFYEVAPGRVRIALTIRNMGDRLSGPTFAEVAAAPLGAFVPWTPLLKIPVPPIPPGGVRTVTAEAFRKQVKPLGPPDQVPPWRLLTALWEDDEPGARSGFSRSGRPTLPADLFDLLRRGNPHFAGNLNVFVGSRSVERHVARALRIYPGRTNLAFFIVGSRPDAYRFELTGAGPGWEADLRDMSHGSSLVAVNEGRLLSGDQWHETKQPAMLMLAIVPPDPCSETQVDVHVRQRSTNREAVVEFSLSPDAAGPGCYTVD